MRFRQANIEICRFGPNYSKYAMAKHKAETSNKLIDNLLENATERIQTDGIDSLKFKEKYFKLLPLYTHILVEL